jgi:hypothetical protein
MFGIFAMPPCLVAALQAENAPTYNLRYRRSAGHSVVATGCRLVAAKDKLLDTPGYFVCLAQIRPPKNLKLRLNTAP